jgi:hypothetical protein
MTTQLSGKEILHFVQNDTARQLYDAKGWASRREPILRQRAAKEKKDAGQQTYD